MSAKRASPYKYVNYGRAVIYIAIGIVLIFFNKTNSSFPAEVWYVFSALCILYGGFRLYRAIYGGPLYERHPDEEDVLDSDLPEDEKDKSDNA